MSEESAMSPCVPVADLPDHGTSDSVDDPRSLTTSPGAKPRISVVIPTYNCWPLLRRAIRTALAQTYLPHEIIVVDDGSTDGTVDRVAAEFRDPVSCHRQANGGPSRARNTGAHLSSGEWLAFLDAD